MKKKYSFKELKEYLISLKNETDINAKEIKRKFIIENSFHFVYDFINKNALNVLITSVYDIDDIISTCCEIWIELIDNDYIINSAKYCIVENKLFYELTNKLITNKENISEFLKSQITEVENILYEFILTKYKKIDFDYNDYIELLKKQYYNYRFINTYFYNKSDYEKLYIILTNIYDSLNISEIDINKLSKTKIKLLKYIFINKGIENSRVDINKVVVSNLSEIIEDNFRKNKLLEIIFESNILNEKEKEIIKRRFGIDGNDVETCREIAESYNLSKTRIQQIEAKALRKLRCSNELRKQYKGE